MKFITILLLLFLFANCSPSKYCKPEKRVRPIKFKGFMTINATVDYILKEGDSVEVIVKKRRGYNNTGYDFFSAKFPSKSLPDSIKIGTRITLHPTNTDTCAYVFRRVK